MDFTTVLNAVYTFIATIVSTIYSLLLGIADFIPFGIGRILLLILALTLVWFYLLPHWAREKARPHIPRPWSLSTPLRYAIVHMLANREWLREKGVRAPGRQVEVREKTVYVPRRRTFREWLASGFRWGIFYFIVLFASYAVYLNWDTLRLLGK